MLLATPTTVDTGRYPKLLTPAFGMTQLVTAELVTVIEAGHAPDSEEMRAVLGPIFERIHHIEPDIIVLGCTHFSWVVMAFQAEFPMLTVFNSAACLAADVAILVAGSLESRGNTHFMLNTLPSDDFDASLRRLGFSIPVNRFEVASLLANEPLPSH